MKKVFVGVLFFVVGCSGAPNEASSEISSAVSSACCTFNGTTMCAGPTVAVQWDDKFWTSNPAEDDAGACMTGDPCTAYARTDAGGLEPIGNGTCE